MKQPAPSCLLFLCALFAGGQYAPAVQAARFTVSQGPPNRLSLAIGSGGVGIDEVAFSVSIGQLGNGQPVSGNATVRVRASNRSATPVARAAVLTADSSMSMTNGSAFIPMTSISWTSRNDELPSGRFDGTGSQLLLTMNPQSDVNDVLSFSYDNRLVLEPGDYTGRVTFTLTMP